MPAQSRGKESYRTEHTKTSVKWSRTIFHLRLLRQAKPGYHENIYVPCQRHVCEDTTLDYMPRAANIHMSICSDLLRNDKVSLAAVAAKSQQVAMSHGSRIMRYVVHADQKVVSDLRKRRQSQISAALNFFSAGKNGQAEKSL